MKISIRSFLQLVVAAAALVGVVPVLFTACAVPGVTLAPDGPSQGDVVAYDFKLALTTQHALLQTFLDWEAANAPLLANVPAVHELAVRVRVDGPGWFRAADEKYQLYAAIPRLPENASKLARAQRDLTAALAVLQGFVAQANQSMLTAAAPASP